VKRIIGIDPGLVHAGWGIVDVEGSSMKFVACGVLKVPTNDALSVRLHALASELQTVLATHRPTDAAIEETFATPNGASTLKLGQARGALMLTLAQGGLRVAEYSAKVVKKALVGNGNAEKQQVTTMVGMLLPSAREALGSARHDASDALAIAICHAHSVKSYSL